MNQPDFAYLVRLGIAARLGTPAAPADLAQFVIAAAHLIAPAHAKEIASQIAAAQCPPATKPEAGKRGRRAIDDSARLAEMQWLIREQGLSALTAAQLVAGKDEGPKQSIAATVDRLRTKYRALEAVEKIPEFSPD